MELMFEELIENEITRRRLLRQAGAGALGLSFAGFLAACGDGGGDGKEDASAIPKGQISDTLNFSNWPYYIEPAPFEEGKSKTLNGFEKKYGTKVKYTEEINDNTEFFGKVRQQYAQGRSGGRDLHVVTDWLCARMKRLGYVQKLDKSEMPNVVRNIEDAVASPDFDPKREFSVPWQSGQVLRSTRRDKTGKDITDVNELFDPKYKGKVTMLSEMRTRSARYYSLTASSRRRATLDQAMNAIDRIEKAEGRTDSALHRQRLRPRPAQG